MKTFTSVIFVTGLMLSSGAALAVEPSQELSEQVTKVLAAQAAQVTIAIQQQISESLQASVADVVALATVDSAEETKVVAVKSKVDQEVAQPESMME
jgi:hypothetical protein